MKQQTYNIGKLTGSQLITKLCDKMLLISGVWFMTTHYGRDWLTALLVFSALPHFFCTFVSGKLIRKWTPLFTMIGTDYFRSVFFFVVVGYLYFYQQMSPAPLLFVFFITNCAAAFFNPAMLTLPLYMADKSHLQRIMSLISGTIYIAGIIGQEVFDNFLETANKIVTEKKHEEYTESKDVSLIDFISKKSEYQINYVSVHQLTVEFKQFIVYDDDETKWLNSRWVGRALKRLKLTTAKRRMSRGIEVTLNINKAKEKLRIFKDIPQETEV